MSVSFADLVRLLTQEQNLAKRREKGGEIIPLLMTCPVIEVPEGTPISEAITEHSQLLLTPYEPRSLKIQYGRNRDKLDYFKNTRLYIQQLNENWRDYFNTVNVNTEGMKTIIALVRITKPKEGKEKE